MTAPLRPPNRTEAWRTALSGIMLRSRLALLCPRAMMRRLVRARAAPRSGAASTIPDSAENICCTASPGASGRPRTSPGAPRPSSAAQSSSWNPAAGGGTEKTSPGGSEAESGGHPVGSSRGGGGSGATAATPLTLDESGGQSSGTLSGGWGVNGGATAGDGGAAVRPFPGVFSCSTGNCKPQLRSIIAHRNTAPPPEKAGGVCCPSVHPSTCSG